MAGCWREAETADFDEVDEAFAQHPGAVSRGLVGHAGRPAGTILETPGLEGKPWGWVAGTRLGKRDVSFNPTKRGRGAPTSIPRPCRRIRPTMQAVPASTSRRSTSLLSSAELEGAILARDCLRQPRSMPPDRGTVAVEADRWSAGGRAADGGPNHYSPVPRAVQAGPASHPIEVGGQNAAKVTYARARREARPRGRSQSGSKKPGDDVAKYELLLEVIMDKVNVESRRRTRASFGRSSSRKGATVPNNAEIGMIDEVGGATHGCHDPSPPQQCRHRPRPQRCSNGPGGGPTAAAAPFLPQAKCFDNSDGKNGTRPRGTDERATPTRPTWGPPMPG